MTTMPLDCIQEQHDTTDVRFRAYIVGAARSQGTRIPEGDHTEGENHAELYRGVWIIRCKECSGVVAATTKDLRSFCPDCGAGWWDIVFPANKDAIEEELLKRPRLRGRMVFANWKPYGGVDYKNEPTGKAESMAQLRRETTTLLLIEEAQAGK